MTKISFDLTSATPKLLFKPVGLVSDEVFAAVQEVANSDIVRNITGNGFSSPVPELATTATVSEEPLVNKKPVVKAKPKDETEEVPKPAPKAKAAEIEIDDLNLDDLNFDD